MKKTKKQLINAGGASVIVIFVVLCLSMLGALAVSASYGDLKLSERYRASVADYYKADAKAQQTLFLLDSIPIKKIKEEITDIETITVNETQYGAEVTFFVPVDEKQSLKVTAKLKEQIEKTIEVSSYRLIRTKQEDYSGTLNLWNGTFE